MADLQQALNGEPTKPAPWDIKFEADAISALGTGLDDRGDTLDGLVGHFSRISIGGWSCGAIGSTLPPAHGHLVNSNTDAMAAARRVMANWKEKLQVTAANYKAAEDRNGDGVGDLGDGPPIDTPGLGADVPGLGGDVPGLGTNDLEDPALSGLGMPDTATRGRGFNDDLPDSNLPGRGDLPAGTPGLDDVPSTEVPRGGAPDPSDMPDTGGLDGMPQSPDGTDLSGYTPPSGVDPASLRPPAQSSGTAIPNGTGFGAGQGSPSGAGIPSAGAAGRGMGGMPFFPMAPGMGAGAGNKSDKQDNDLLSGNPEDFEDEDIEIAPAVLQQEAEEPIGRRGAGRRGR